MNPNPLTKDLIGKRILIKDYGLSYIQDLTEAGILEVSPSGQYCKIQIRKRDNTTFTKWCNVTQYIFIEELPSVMDKITDEFLKWEEETKKKAREEFHKHSTTPYTPPPYQTGDFWEHLPTSICSSDYADAPDITATNYSSEVEKQKWVHGICNPPSPDWKREEEKEYVKENTSTGKRYNSVDEMLDDLRNPDNCWNS